MSLSATRPSRRPLRLESLESRIVLSAEPLPVLLVIPNKDFYYQDYGDTRRGLEDAGVPVQVAAATLDVARPHAYSGQGSDGGLVLPDLTVADADAADYSAVVFVGGWGASSYQYAFSGTYGNYHYNGDTQTRAAVNELVNDFVDQDKFVTGVCFGVSVLAWARVDGVSPLAGRSVAAYQGAAPWANVGQANGAWHVSTNGANLVAPNSVGDPTTAADDVIVDGKVITAENFQSAYRFGEVVAEQVIAAAEAAAEPLPVLLVIANRDFYYQEYGDTRASLEAAGLDVVVAAGSLSVAVPHWNSGQGADGGYVTPDITLSDADAANYSAIVFVGGWGSSSYQYAFGGTYNHGEYNGQAATRQAVNDLIGDFVAQDKYVAGLCHGVTVLAYARVDGVSLLDGVTVAAYAGFAPTFQGMQADQQTTRYHTESNGATQLASGSIGDPATRADDVFIDGRIITGENYDSASAFGAIVASRVLAEA